MIDILPIPVLPSLDALDVGAVAGLELIPALIIDEPFAGSRFPSISLTVKRVGKRLAGLTDGKFDPEGIANVGTGVPTHVDGLSANFWQINTSRWFSEFCSPAKTEVVGAKFIISEFATGETFGIDIFSALLRGRNAQRTAFYLNDVVEREGRVRLGITKELERRRQEPLVENRRYEGFVPSGGTIIFRNGTGIDPAKLIMHSTKSAIKTGAEISETMRFSRYAALGSVTLN